jgi:hypothetical protein
MLFDDTAIVEHAAGDAPFEIKGRTPRLLGEKLLDALRDLANGKARIQSHVEKAWASITFAGTKHTIDIVFEGAEAVEAGECFIAFLPTHEFSIPGQLVADAAVLEVDHRAAPPILAVRCEILLLEEG